jgi:predicted permease
VSKLFQVMARDYLRSLIVALISAAIAVPLICVLIFIPLGIASRTDDTTTALLIMAIPAAIFLLIMLGGGAETIFFVFFRRARRYDAIFEPLGLK